MKDFNDWPTALQIVVSAVLAIPITTSLIIIVMAIFSLNMASYLATTSLWIGVIMAYLAARNNGGVREIRAMLVLVSAMAIVSTLGTLRHLGLVSISPRTLTRMFSATLVLTGMTLTVVFGAKYVRAKRLKRRGMAEVTVRAKIPLRVRGHGGEECNGLSS